MDESPIGPHSSSPEELRARIEAERRGMPFLVYRDGDGRQRIVDLGTAEKLSIGRKPENDVALTWDHGVSRVHATLERVGGEWTIVDDGLSQNGSWVNAERVVGRRRVQDGDRLRFGKSVVAFSAPFERNTEPTSAQASTWPDSASLSERQKAVLVALARPWREREVAKTPATNQEIADEVHLSVDAVKGHLRVLFDKFGIGDLPQNKKRSELVWRAFQQGVITPRDLWPGDDGR